jgi:predicted Mrr-cat superfamily restriction endonuclease
MHSARLGPGMTQAWRLWMVFEGKGGRRVNLAPERLEAGEIVVGWGKVRNLPRLEREEYAPAIRKAYGKRRQGAAVEAGSAWRFLREMSPKDRVVVPISRTHYHVAQVRPGPVQPDGPYFVRKVTLLSPEEGYEREDAPEDLQRRMRVPQTCVDITDLAAQVP